MSAGPLRLGVVPIGRGSHGTRSPIVWVRLCAPCAGFAPTTDMHGGRLAGRCQGCGVDSHELHRFAAHIDSASGCSCDWHESIRGDLAVNRDEEAVELLHRLRDLCEENSLMGEQINEWLEELRGMPDVKQARRDALAAFVGRRDSLTPNHWWVCPACAALVSDPEKHLDWHGASPNMEGALR